MKQFSYLFLCIAFCACNMPYTADTNGMTTYSMTVEHVIDSIPFDSIVESFDYVRLETVPQALVGDVSCLIVDDGNFYVVSDAVYSFDRDGQFRYAINKRGHERSEFVTCSSVSVSKDYVHVYDASSMRILSYDKGSGKYVQSGEIGCTPYRAYVNGDCMIFDHADFADGDDPSCRFSVRETKTNAPKYASLEDSAYKRLLDKQLTLSSSDVLFTDYFSCTTYKITADSCYAYFRLDIPERYRYSQRMLHEMQGKRVRLSDGSSDDGKIVGLRNVHETDTLIWGECLYAGEFARVIYSKYADSGVMFKSVTFGSGQIPPLSIDAGDDSCFYSIMSAADIYLAKAVLGQEELLHNAGFCNENRTLLSDCNPEDNPIIIRYRLRNGRE